MKEVPPEWFDLTEVYNPAVDIPYLRQARLLPKPELKEWFTQAGELSFEQYRKFMRGRFRALAAADPRAPLDLILQWAYGTGGLPGSAILRSWVGELLSLVHRDDSPETLQRHINNAFSDGSKMWSQVTSIGRQLWRDLSGKQIQERLIAWLADHAAAHLWGCKWLQVKIWPQTARREPSAQERRSKDVMTAWSTMKPLDAVRGAQLERIFGEDGRKADSAYNPEHPLAHAVKIENAKPPAQGQKAFLLIITIVPLILHHRWSLVDIARCLILVDPDLASQFDLGFPSERDAAARYVKTRLLKPMGLGNLTNRPGRPRASADDLSRGFGSARLSALYLRALPMR